MKNESIDYLNNPEVEETLLATLIRFPEMIEQVYVKPSFLTQEINKQTLQAILDIKRGGYEVDIATLLDYMTQYKAYDSKTLYERLTTLANSEFQTTNLKYHQDKIIELYKKRNLKSILEKSLNNLNVQTSSNAFKGILEAFETIEAISSSDEQNGHISEVMKDVYESLENVDDSMLKKTHFKNVDAFINWKRQDFVILGARPSAGKTALAMNFAMNHAELNDSPVIVFSKEMPNVSVGTRMLASDAIIQMDKLKNPSKLEIKDWEKIGNSIGSISKQKIHMFDSPKLTVADIKQVSKRIAKLYPGEHILVVIDYLQLIDSENPRKTKNEQVGEISRELKQLARELDGTVMALAQLSRNVEQRNDKRPMNSDLRDSGEIEQDADVIAMIYRDDYYNKDSQTPNLTELIITKNRNGAVGTAELLFIKEISKFKDFS